MNKQYMSKHESAVFDVLRGCTGADNAIIARDIGNRVGLTARSVRDIIRHLRMRFRQPIASSPGNPAGFYIASTPEELRATSNRWRSFGLRNLVLAARLSKTTQAEFVGQVMLDLTTELN